MYQFVTIPGIRPPVVFFKTGRDLGPNQIRWLTEKVPGFGIIKEQADKAIAHTAETVATMPAPISATNTGDPGSTPPADGATS